MIIYLRAKRSPHVPLCVFERTAEFENGSNVLPTKDKKSQTSKSNYSHVITLSSLYLNVFHHNLYLCTLVLIMSTPANPPPPATPQPNSPPPTAPPTNPPTATPQTDAPTEDVLTKPIRDLPPSSGTQDIEKQSPPDSPSNDGPPGHKTKTTFFGRLFDAFLLPFNMFAPLPDYHLAKRLSSHHDDRINNSLYKILIGAENLRTRQWRIAYWVVTVSTIIFQLYNG